MREDALTIRKGLRQAVDAGGLTPGEAASHRLALRRTRAILTLLPDSRARELAAVLHDVAALSRSYTRARAVALFSMLEANAEFLAAHRVPEPGTDIVAGDGVVYRLFSGHGFQFHPLGNFGALNEHVTRGRDADAALLAASLLARAVKGAGGLAWEYYFPFGGGRPPWTSGMAQAVAAQALARAGSRVGDPRLTEAGARAYRLVPGRLVMALDAGPWIRHYSFSGLVVLNAQLQAILSLADHAAFGGDPAADDLAAAMEATTRTMFPLFDTGYWSLYSLGNESPLGYHLYVVSLLRKLADRSADPFWAETAERFDLYLTQPPLFRPARPVPPLYPVPAEGFRDEGNIRFWISKPSTVEVVVGGERFAWSLPGGWHRFAWRPGKVAPGVYPVRLTAVDLAGNSAEGELTTVEIRRDTDPPKVEATVERGRLAWRGTDEGTPWLRLALRLERPGASKTIRLGRHPLSGRLRLDLPPLRWDATLVAADSSGNRARVPLGQVGRRD